MIAIPAIDLRHGACVQLVGGDYAQERVRLDDPVAVASDWIRYGFRSLHVVDLDAATGRGSNAALVRRIVSTPAEVIQVGGGVRDERTVGELLASGATRAVVGTRALEDPGWLESITTAFPGRIVLAADVRNRLVLTRGWSRTLDRTVLDVIAEFGTLPLAAFLITAVHREGRLEGPDLDLIASVVAHTSVPVQASGGITTLEDLRELARRGVVGAVLGMALYTGTLDPSAAAEEFTG